MNDTTTDRLIKFEAGQRQLFLDNYSVESMEGLQLKMHQPAKKGAVIRPEKPWEIALQNRCAPAWDPKEGKYRMWIVTGGVHGGTACVESKDGINWTRPILRQRMFQGSLENNFVTPDPKLEWPDNAMENIVYDPDDSDPACRYKGFVGANDRRPIVSPDGIHWKLLDDIHLISGDESNLSYDRPACTFIATMKVGGPFGRSHEIRTSTDFREWTTHALFSADAEDQRRGKINIEKHFADGSRLNYNIPEAYNVDVYNLGVFRYEGLYIGMPSMFHQTGKVDGSWEGFDRLSIDKDMWDSYKKFGDKGGFHHVQLMCSRDLKNWDRLGSRQPFLDLSPLGTGAYDVNTIMPPSSAVVKEDEFWFYYTGQKSYGLELSAEEAIGRSAICLAVLRRDGFISLDAAEEAGTLLTHPFVLSGRKLSVNVDASEGVFEATVLDDRGRELAVSSAIAHDKPHCEVQWKRGSMAGMEGRRVQIRFSLRKARFYSFWFDQ